MDRITPTRRPERENAGTQKWRDLAFLHFEVPVELVRSQVPPELELDLWEGKALVGVVPFAMFDVRPRWVPYVPGVSDFLELNVRTYVVAEGRYPGVHFFSLEAESTVAVAAARAGWGLPYFRASMDLAREEDVITYRSQRLFPGPTPAVFQGRYRVGPALGPSEPGGLAHFLAERYLLFTVDEGVIRAGQVSHTPYPLHELEVLQLDQSMLAAAGLPGEHPLFSAHYAPGVDVEVFGLVPPAQLGF
jgi:uncharacterized protein YqjF (DUF2071 family)